MRTAEAGEVLEVTHTGKTPEDWRFKVNEEEVERPAEGRLVIIYSEPKNGGTMACKHKVVCRNGNMEIHCANLIDGESCGQERFLEVGFKIKILPART